jgi:hypothetical protein
MYTVPGGVPSISSSPATPVVATVTSASNNIWALSAISTAACRESTDSAVTPSSARLTSS